MQFVQSRFKRLICVALDHAPQIEDDERSGASYVVCSRCSRFLGIAGAPQRTNAARGLAAAACVATKAHIKSAH